jgi:hypothetical protein
MSLLLCGGGGSSKGADNYTERGCLHPHLGETLGLRQYFTRLTEGCRACLKKRERRNREGACALCIWRLYLRFRW